MTDPLDARARQLMRDLYETHWLVTQENDGAVINNAHKVINTTLRTERRLALEDAKAKLPLRAGDGTNNDVWANGYNKARTEMSLALDALIAETDQ